MNKPNRSRLPRGWFLLQVLVFSGVPFVLAGWLLLAAAQPITVRVFGATLIALAGVWNFVRAWRRFNR